MHFSNTRAREFVVCFESSIFRHLLLELRIFQDSDYRLGDGSRIPGLHYKPIFSMINYFGYTTDFSDDNRLPKGKGSGTTPLCEASI
jgi:hypothetical protein